jgi:hypothetical protein
MKRKPRFFIGFLAAAITFGTLMATIGPRHYKHRAHHCCDKQTENNSMQQNNPADRQSQNN